MLRESQSLYTAGRSESLKKFKPYYDTEVLVLEDNYPLSLKCIQYETCFTAFLLISRANGKQLHIPSSNDAKGVKVGSVITIKHSGANMYGSLLYPKFYRLRTDVKWEDIINANSL
jgi:hypothetical protein